MAELPLIFKVLITEGILVATATALVQTVLKDAAILLLLSVEGKVLARVTVYTHLMFCVAILFFLINVVLGILALS